MAMPELRRSQRLGTYDANGRDYLSSTLGWTRPKFEEWLYSSTVRPYLQEWHSLCIVDRHRFNDAVEWINTGVKGYFYNEDDLEEDLLLMCLGATDNGEFDNGEGGDNTDFANPEINTEGWITQELWARTAWSVVQANGSTGQVFHQKIQDRPAAAYGFVIEMLCIIFHSIAFRRGGSVYMHLLKDGKTSVAMGSARATGAAKSVTAEQIDELTIDDDTEASSSSAADHTSDATFTDPRKKRAASELSTIVLETARPAKKARGENDVGSDIKVALRKPGSLDTHSSLKTADQSSVEGKAEEPLTPDTSISLRGMVVPDGREISKEEWVHGWLEGSTEAQSGSMALG